MNYINTRKLLGLFLFTYLISTNAQAAYRIQDLETLGGSESWAAALNDHGTVVGTADDQNNQFKAFVYKNGKMSTITNDNHGQAWGINNSGIIVGDGSGVRNNNSRDPFIYNNGTVTSVNLPPWLGSFSDVNESGIIIDDTWTNPGSRGFIYENGNRNKRCRSDLFLTTY